MVSSPVTESSRPPEGAKTGLFSVLVVFASGARGDEAVGAEGAGAQLFDSLGAHINARKEDRWVVQDGPAEEATEGRGYTVGEPAERVLDGAAAGGALGVCGLPLASVEEDNRSGGGEREIGGGLLLVVAASTPSPLSAVLIVITTAA
ncbi:hypothetical protein Salat_2384300 [Sesamum alatum]|uniref:Uncharacterized protein n=1 Tax=Sesamum alatum TaxID=300844 RepID=A0AAE1XY08_9LAMI|nr:hypothetical protein Salat_2384300 [Sesamum alatum]